MKIRGSLSFGDTNSITKSGCKRYGEASLARVSRHYTVQRYYKEKKSLDFPELVLERERGSVRTEETAAHNSSSSFAR